MASLIPSFPTPDDQYFWVLGLLRARRVRRYQQIALCVPGIALCFLRPYAFSFHRNFIGENLESLLYVWAAISLIVMAMALYFLIGEIRHDDPTIKAEVRKLDLNDPGQRRDFIDTHRRILSARFWD